MLRVLKRNAISILIKTKENQDILLRRVCNSIDVFFVQGPMKNIESAAPVHEDHIRPGNPRNYLRSALLTISAFIFANLVGCLLLYLLYLTL